MSLALNNFGQMTLFREAMRKVLGKSLRLVDERPSPKAEEFRKLVLETFLSTSKRNAPLRITLLRFASGDWRTPGVFEVFAGPGDTPEGVLQPLVSHFVPVVLSHAPSTWPRARWTGFENAFLVWGRWCASTLSSGTRSQST